MATPHNQAEPGQIAKTVLMPGDPLRAKFVAENWLEEARLVNEVRNMYAYTGRYKGSKITVMGSGMGMPSIGIYSYELYKEYGVDNIIRIGSAGAYSGRLHLYDVVLAQDCFSQSSFALVQNGDDAKIKYPDPVLNQRIMEAAEQLGIPVTKARLHSSDAFYTEANVDGYEDFLKKYGCECVEMESFALFHNAQVLKKRAACLLTISDSFVTRKATSADERQRSFKDMICVALEAAAAMEEC